MWAFIIREVSDTWISIGREVNDLINNPNPSVLDFQEQN